MMESIEKLRYYAKTICCIDGDNVNRFADEIEREIAERYMKLPVDADGVPIHVGDEIEFATKERFTTEGVDAHGTFVWRNDEFDHIQGDSCRHVKPRTIEDVLYELADEIIRQWHQVGLTAPGIIAKYADELRQMGVDNG